MAPNVTFRPGSRLLVPWLTGFVLSACSGASDPSDTYADPPASADSCGDTICSADDAEDCLSCSEDCGACGTCGDGTCEPGVEYCETCPEDCEECGSCGDGTCDALGTEDCNACPEDCGACTGCGDGACSADDGESCESCETDCGVCEPCGDGVCDAGESCETCEVDCGKCDPCGDGVCDADAGEGCETCAQDCGGSSCDVRPGCIQGAFKAYWGNLHSHTSYSDGELTPAAAFSHAKNANLDFLWVTDHKGQMTQAQWESCKAMANDANKDGEFIAGCGYEIVILTPGGAQLGHINFLFVSKMIPRPDGLPALYNAINNCSPCVGQWNHPPNPANFSDFEYHPVAKDGMRMIEFNGAGTWAEKQAEYFRALRKGWLVSPANNEDNHHQNWGDSKRATGLFAAELSRLGIRNAIRNRRTFATSDDTASIKMTADDACWMGSVLQGLGDTKLTVVARDKQDSDGFSRIALLGPQNEELDSKSCGGDNPCTANFQRHVTQERHFVAVGIQKDGDRVISAPIWYKP